ncbi:Nuclear receptor coactivator 5 [Pelobates cultripes]|uniref:Nuclear receptor coactivator 5 n=3 Tax=Pelobates cultripes TaxID=61616 RepID=A0AAD1WFL4_PELCU|nr:Nuclear receptor coactivator 5 [Pelobates cultripes]
MPRQRSKPSSPSLLNRTNGDDPSDLDKTVFIGNLPTISVDRKEMEEMFSKYGKISGLRMFRGYGFVQYEREEDAKAAVQGEKGRTYKGHRLDINKAAEGRNMNKAPSRSSPSRRDLYTYGESRDTKRERSPLRGSPRRDGRDGRDSRAIRDTRESRDGREPRDTRDVRDSRDMRDARDSREPRDMRDTRDARDSRDSREMREARELRDARAVRDSRDIRDPLYDRYRDALYRRDEPLDKYRQDELYRKKEDAFDRFRDPLDRFPREEDRLKREDRRREELYRQYFDEIQRRVDSERPVDCSVIVVNKQSKEYAESVGRKVRDLGMMVDLIFLNTEVSLTQALEDVTRGGSPFAIVITQQHQVHRSCTVNILFGTPQEHRNMPLADAMVLVARNHERFKSEARDKEREDIARQATKMSTDALLRERAPPMDEGLRGTHPPTIQPLLALLADNRYVTPEEMDKVILYLRDRKDRLLSADPLSSQLSRPQMGSSQVTSMDSQSGLTNNQVLQMSQQMSQPMSSAPQTQQSLSNPQQELQAKILSLFNSGSQANINPVGPVGASVAAPNQGYGNVGNSQPRPGQMNTSPLGQMQRNQPAMNQHPNVMGVGVPIRNTVPRPGGPLPSQAVYGQLQNRAQVPVNIQGQRPAGSAGINFDNPSVQKALDTLIQSGPALSHLVNQTAGQGGRGGLPPQPSMGSYQRHY